VHRRMQKAIMPGTSLPAGPLCGVSWGWAGTADNHLALGWRVVKGGSTASELAIVTLVV